jgi:hypothetical protein
LLGHIQRTYSSGIVKRILEWKPVGSLWAGRPRIGWLDDVCNSMKVMNVKNWKELVLKRRLG